MPSEAMDRTVERLKAAREGGLGVWAPGARVCVMSGHKKTGSLADCLFFESDRGDRGIRLRVWSYADRQHGRHLSTDRAS